MTKVSLVTTDAVALSTGISVLPALSLIPQLEPFKAAVANLEAQAQRALIDSEESWQRGSDFETICAQHWEQLEDLRKAVKGPIDDYAKFIQALFLPLQQRFRAAKELVNTKRLTFQRAEQKRREAAAEAIRRANEEATLKLAAEREAQGDTQSAQAIMDMAVMLPLRQPSLRLGGRNTFGKSDSIAKRWTASVEQPMEVLKAILAGHIPMSVIDWKQAELNKVASSLKVEKTVHGLKIFQTETLQQR
jgi:hypothetical protein